MNIRNELNDEEELEVIDIDDDIEEEEEVVEENKDKSKEKEKESKEKNKNKNKDKSTVKIATGKRKLKKGLLFQTIFCAVSIIFIIGCCIFYGTRLVKYYKIYNPKDSNGNAMQLLANKITSGATFVYDGDGIYLTGGTYTYKGEKVDNYIKYGNLVWRILKINSDKSIDIVLDSSINNLKWNSNITDYSKSDVATYLNDEFIKILNKKTLAHTIVCTDKVDDISKIKCNTTDTSNYVRLLNIGEFINSKASGKSFISNGSSVWLSTRGEKQVWAINGTSLSYTDPAKTYDVKPVVTLKNTTKYVGGRGTKKEPYEIEEKSNNVMISDHIKLGSDTWTVYKIEGNKLYLSLSTLYGKGTKTYRFDLKNNKYDPKKASSLAKYLNETYLNTLPYKNKLEDCTWNTGTYESSYKDIYKEKITAKVGISSVTDLKFDSGVKNYYILNGTKDGKAYLYSDYLTESKVTLARAIKPSICIKKATIKTGDGSLTKPYTLEG